MSISDFWHSPPIDTAVVSLNNSPRIDPQDSAFPKHNSSAVPEPSVRFIEETAGSSFGENSFQGNNAERVAIFEHNSKIEAQEIARQPSPIKGETGSRKGIAVVASASESVATHDALARLDQNGDGRIDQVEVKKGIRADESTSTFAALSQYQISPELHQKLNNSEEFDYNKLYESDVVKVEKIFDDEKLDQDLYQDNFQEPRKKIRGRRLVC
jgi:hypothetical protein